MAKKTRSEMIAEQLMRFGRQAKQGATLGFADEAEDLLAAAIAYPMTRDTGLTYAELLSDARKASKQELGEDWKNNLAVSLAGQVVGGIPLGASKAGKAAADWIRSGSALQGIGRGAAVGAGLGGVAGMGAADDTMADRAIGGASGAAIGGLLGGATAPLSRIGNRPDAVDYRKVTEKTAKAFDNKAQQELARQLSARPDLPEHLARAEAMAAASQRSGIPLTLAETVAQSSSDPLLAQQAVLGSNPMTAGRMAQMYAARSGTPQQLSGQARPLYEQAYQAALPEGSDILKNPLIQSALEKVRGNPVYAQEIGGLADNSIQALDAVKRSLDDMAEAANRAGNRNEARLINNARTQLLGAMDAASPEYAQARNIYSGNPDALAMRERIGALADIDPMNARRVGQQLFSGTQQNADLAAQALGERAPTAAAARIYGAMDELRNDPVNIASRIAPDQRTSDMLRSYAGQQYAPIEEALNVINQAKLGERMRHGSPTQPRMEAEKGLETAANAAIDVATGGKTTLLRRIAGMFGRGSEQTDPQFYADMADLMLTDKGMDLLRRVANGQQTAIQELQSVGLPSLVAGSAASPMVTSPVSRALIGGMATPAPEDRSPVFVDKQPNLYQSLPQGFVIMPQQNQPLQQLPPGFIIQE